MTAAKRPGAPAPAAADLDDSELVARALGGDRAALRALYDRHRPAVHRLASVFASLDEADRDDVVQDAFVRAFENLGKLARPARFRAWILAIARNRALSRLSARKSREQLAGDLSRETEALALGVSAMPDPWAAAELDVVRRIIEELPEGPEKETVRLFYVEGELTAREIGELLGVGKSTVTMRLERFRSKVKRRLLALVAGLRGGES